jgi:hypothetical protein
MREIKFRAWNGQYMINMEYGDWISFSGIPYTEASRKYDTPNIEIELAKNYVLMQFTGLYDVKKKEIYRGMQLGMPDGDEILILGRVEYCDKPGCLFAGSYYLADENGYATDWASEDEGKPENWHNLEIIDEGNEAKK